MTQDTHLDNTDSVDTYPDAILNVPTYVDDTGAIRSIPIDHEPYLPMTLDSTSATIWPELPTETEKLQRTDSNLGWHYDTHLGRWDSLSGFGQSIKGWFSGAKRVVEDDEGTRETMEGEAQENIDGVAKGPVIEEDLMDFVVGGTH